uniref:Villin-3 n=1 Tax=Rhizophora mucronata TaxID=61149 RepID=A0A2P2MLQ3_RHIMU
MMILQNFVKEN